MSALLFASISRKSFNLCRIHKIARYISITRPLYQDSPMPTQHQQYRHNQNEHQQSMQKSQQLHEQGVVVHGAQDIRDSDVTVEVNEQNLTSAVLESQVPVIVEFYSDQEEGCALQSKLLKTAVEKTEGLVKLCRVNADRHPYVMESMGVSIELLPACLFVCDGRVIGKFFGKGQVIEKSQLDSTVNSLLKVAGLKNVKALLKSAENALECGDIAGAHQIYNNILHSKQLHSEAVALAGLAICALHSKNSDQAKELLEVIRNNYKDQMENPHVKKAFVAVDLTTRSEASNENEAELKDKLQQNPKDLEAKYNLAVLYTASNRQEQAIEEAMGMIKIDKQYNEQAARTLLLQIFEMLGTEHALAVKGRKRLSSLWFLS